MCCSVPSPEIVMHDVYIGGCFRKSLVKPVMRQKTCVYRVIRFFHPRSSCMTTHISADVQRITLNASCITISGGRTKQLDIFCRITGFTSDFLSFIVWNLLGSFTEPFSCNHCLIRLSVFQRITCVVYAVIPSVL